MKIRIVPSLIRVNHDMGNSPEAIVIHETDNTDPGADARAHARFFNNPDNEVSVHYVVDEDEIIQLLPHDRCAWHCGGGNNYSNRNTIGIEICVNGDYERARNNAILLTAYLVSTTGIRKVIRHYDVTGKLCPARMMKDPGSWIEFRNKALSLPLSSIEVQTVPGGIGAGPESAESSKDNDRITGVLINDVIVRKGRGTSEGAIGILKKGTHVVCLYLMNGWWSIDYGPTYGFIPADTIRLDLRS